MSQKVRKEYTPQQKAEAVGMVTATNQSIRQVAQNLGIAESSLSRWVRESKGSSGSKSPAPLTPEERQELVQLRRQVKQLEMERDFLKKATAFFARLPALPFNWPSKGGRSVVNG